MRRPSAIDGVPCGLDPLHTREVGGSIPPVPIRKAPGNEGFSSFWDAGREAEEGRFGRFLAVQMSMTAPARDDLEQVAEQELRSMIEELLRAEQDRAWKFDRERPVTESPNGNGQVKTSGNH
jgi:hypothetical protein